MSSAVAELEAGLQAMLGLKPPGVSGSRITSVTSLCVANVQSESVLIQKIYTHFKKAPGTHKLGVLYVVDSVTRKWMDQAKAQGQPITSTAQDGTFAAGVHRVTELLPVLMNDIIASCPEDQKEKIKKLVDIWEKGQTFPPALLSSFKEKLNAPPPPSSTTPPGSPPANLAASIGVSSKPAAPAVPSGIMEALANIARQNTTLSQGNPSLAAPTPAPAPQTSAHTPGPTLSAAPAYSMPGSVAGSAPAAFPGALTSGVAPAAAQPHPSIPYLPASQPAAQPVNVPGFPFGFPAQAQPAAQAALQGALNGASNPAGGYLGNPAPPAASAGLDPKVQQQLVLIQTLAAQGIPIDKITSIISQVMGTNTGAAAAPPQVAQPPQSSYQAPAAAGHWQPPHQDESRDLNPYHHDPARSPNHQRGRSRSPSRHWDSRDSPRGRGKDRGFDYGRNSPGRGRDGARDRGSDYRQRSPLGRRESPREPLPHEKWIEYDSSMPSGHIKVYSRTLFVGGVTCSDNELRQIFSRHGEVQTCIVNKEKRHAFVKMYLRKDAVNAKEAMEDTRNLELPLRTRWGVGFGPRDCSDYSTGVSVIPIQKLTDADRKWMLTAPYGGSGGKPVVSGMCVEEPDIEIGAGVSSKAISRRMQTDKGGSHGPKSTRREEELGHNGHNGHGHVGGGGGGGGGGDGGEGRGGRGGRWRQRHRGEGRDNNRRDERHEKAAAPTTANEEPVVAGLPPGITMGPNGINFPPGFAFAPGSNA